MTIKEVSEKYGISQDTLRYYEKIGMIPKVHRTHGGIRNYTEEDLRWLDLVICLKMAGLPIAAMTEYIHLYQQGDTTIVQRLDLLKQHRETLLLQRRKLDATLEHLEKKIVQYEKDML